MKKIIAAFVAVIGMMIVSAPPAEANMISDAASSGYNVVKDAGSVVVNVVMDGVHWTAEMLIENCDKLNACAWIRKQSKHVLEAVSKWMSDHPYEAALIQIGLVILVPIAGEAILAESTAAFGGFDLLGIGSEEIVDNGLVVIEDASDEGIISGSFSATEKEIAQTSLDEMANPALAEEAISESARPVLKEAAAKAAANGEDTFSICEESENACTVVEKQARLSGWAKKTVEDLLEKQGNRSATGAELDMSDVTPRKWAVDHILPLACGGTNDPSNLQILTDVENSAKGSFEGCTKIPVSMVP